MSYNVISVEHLTKQYDLGVIGTGTISRDLNRWWARVRKQPDPYTRIGQRDAFERIGESILALDDVSFTVQQGEALGIIGRNGAGKSTLLKILSRVTAPTTGVVKIKGRIGSLLEVGTGFHPELTGRENTYLNGAILGMKKAEVTRKFDEIVAFAGVEKFIDTPVKRYSSGMYVRLAFAVAAHLDPEILIVDEVLAVGDAEFQKKCLGKMGDVAGEGRTVLFVSHNMASIQNLCPRSLLLLDGSIILDSPSDDVIGYYLTSNEVSLGKPLSEYRQKWATPYIDSIVAMDSYGSEKSTFRLGENIKFRVHFNTLEKPPISKPVLGLVINHSKQEVVGGVNMRMTGFNYTKEGYLEGYIECELLSPTLLQGHYSVDFWLGDGLTDIDAVFGYLRFTVEETDVYGTGKAPFSHLGVIYFSPKWKIVDNE